MAIISLRYGETLRDSALEFCKITGLTLNSLFVIALTEYLRPWHLEKMGRLGPEIIDSGAGLTPSGNSVIRGKAVESPGTPKNIPGRNAPCPCGSGLKYKKCCGK